MTKVGEDLRRALVQHQGSQHGNHLPIALPSLKCGHLSADIWVLALLSSLDRGASALHVTRSSTYAWLWHVSRPAGCTWQILFHPLFCLCDCKAACKRTKSLMAFSCQLRNSWPVTSSIHRPAQYGEGWQVAASTWITKQQETPMRGFAGWNARKRGFQVPDSWLPPVIFPKAHAGSLTGPGLLHPPPTPPDPAPLLPFLTHLSLRSWGSCKLLCVAIIF